MATEIELRSFGKRICAVAAGELMSREEACEAYRQVILNEQPELQQGAFLLAHITRGPSVAELGGAWEALHRYDTAKIEVNIDGPICDIVGTGSDPLKTVNCSTPAALIAAACGLPVAKKGARLVTGVSGASDILEELGVDLDAPLQAAEKCLQDKGICYLPGEAFLQSGWARLIQVMRFTSAFNIIGPLTMPCAQTNCIVIGGYSPMVCDQLIAVLKEIDMPRAVAPFGMVQGIDTEKGMDEYSPAGPTRVVELRNGAIETYEVTPADFGIKELKFSAVASSPSAKENAQRVKAVLSGEYDTPDADFFCMNAAAALYASDMVVSYKEGFERAKTALAEGTALQKLDELILYQGKK